MKIRAIRPTVAAALWILLWVSIFIVWTCYHYSLFNLII